MMLNRLQKTQRKSINYSALCQQIPKRNDILIDKNPHAAFPVLRKFTPMKHYADINCQSSHPYQKWKWPHKAVFVKRSERGADDFAIKTFTTLGKGGECHDRP